MTDAALSAQRRRLWALGAIGVVLATCVVGFNLLFLFAPEGWAPYYGFEPNIEAAYARVLPMPALTLSAPTLNRWCAALLAGMWIAYVAAVLIAGTLRDRGAERNMIRLVIIGGTLMSVALILTPPVLSGDVYHYAMFGRMIVTRGLNPYVTPGSVMAGDPIWALASWHNYSTHYGPVFTGLSVIAAWIGAGGAVATAIALKALTTAFGALAAWAAASLAKREGRGALLPLMLIAWNPLALIETAGSGHNEMIMMGLALAGLYFMRAGRTYLGFVLLIASVHVKWVTAALVGLEVIARLRDINGVRARAKHLAQLLLIAIAVTVVVYLPFWTGLKSMGTVLRLLLEPGNASSDQATRLSYLIPFGVATLVAIGVVARNGSRSVLDMATVAALSFVLFAFNWIFPWYVLPAVVLLAPGPLSFTNGGLLIAATAGSVFLMSKWVLIAQLAR